MKTMRKKIISGLLLLSMLITLWMPAFADAPPTQTWTGWLIDYDCVGANPKTHTQTCNLMPTCIASGEGMYVYSEGKAYNTYNAANWLPFDQASHLLAARLNQILSDSSDHEAHLAKYPDRIPTIKVTGYLVNNIPYHDSDPGDPNDQAQLPITDPTKSVTGTVTGIHITSIEFTYITYNSVAVSNYEVTDPEKTVITEAAAVTVPGAPTSVSAAAGNSQATVSFTAPDFNGGDGITGYKVQTYSGGEFQKTTVGTGSPITVTDLLNGTSYTFTVRAVNPAGDGPESTTSAAVIPVFSNPDPPALSADTPVTEGDRVTLSFTADDSWQKAIAAVTVNGNLIDGSLYAISPGNIKIDGSLFNEAGDYTITVQAAGYTTGTVNQTVNNATSWIRNYGSTWEDKINAVAKITDDGYIAVGYTSYYDGSLLAPNDSVYKKRGLVIKYDKTGGIVWTKEFPDSSNLTEQFYSVQQTADGGYIIAGTRDWSTAGNVYSDAQIIKLKGDGEKDWQTALSGSYPSSLLNYIGQDYGNKLNAVRQTDDGGYIAAGCFTSDDGDFTGILHGSISTSNSDAIFAKFSNTGAVEWKKSIGGTNNNDAFNDVQLTPDGGYIAVGASSSIDGDFAPQTTGAGTVYYHYGTTVNSKGVVSYKGGYDDGILFKFDSSGNEVWKKIFGGNKHEVFKAGRVTDDGGYIVAGSAVSIDASLLDKNLDNNENEIKDSLGNIYYTAKEAIFVKYNSSGDLGWFKGIGGAKADEFNSLERAADGGYIAVGIALSNDGDFIGLHRKLPTATTWSDQDAVAVKITADGKIIWKKDFGGTKYDTFTAVKETNAGHSIVAAGFSSSTDFDLSGQTGHGDYDAIFVKFLIPQVLSAEAHANIGEDVTLSFPQNAAWQNSIDEVLVKGNVIDSGKYSISQGSIKIDSSCFAAAGDYDIVVQAAGYTGAAVIQTIIQQLQPPALSADAQVNVGENVTLGFPEDANWRNAIQTVVVNGNVLAANLYVISPGSIEISSSVFAAYGDYSIRVRAAGYPDTAITQKVTEPGKLTPPVLSVNGASSVGKNIILSFTADTAWQNAITSVIANGNAIGSNLYTLAAGSIVLNSSIFTEAGEYAIQVKATGYSDATVTVSIPTYLGWLIDYDCAGGNPYTHTQTCNLMSTCIASGFGIVVYTPGKAGNTYSYSDWVPFDQKSHELARQLNDILSSSSGSQGHLEKYNDTIPTIKVSGYPVSNVPYHTGSGGSDQAQLPVTDISKSISGTVSGIHITSIEFTYITGVSNYEVTLPEKLVLREVEVTSKGAVTGNSIVKVKAGTGTTLKYNISSASVSAKSVVEQKRNNASYVPDGLIPFSSGAEIKVPAGQYIHVYEISNVSDTIAGYGEHQVTADEIAAPEEKNNGGGKPVDPTIPKTWTGWLIDYDCVGANPKTHTQDCNLMPTCIASGFGIQVAGDDGAPGSWIPFDSTGQSLANQLNLKLSDPDDPEKHLAAYPNLIPTIRVTGYLVTTGLPSNITDYPAGIHISSIEFYYIEGVSAYRVTVGASGNPASPTTESAIGAKKSPDPIKDAATGKVFISLTAKLDKTTATAKIGEDLFKNAFELADVGTNGRKAVSIGIPKVEGAESYQLQIPASLLTSGSGTREIVIKTDIGTLTIPDNLLGPKQFGVAENIILSIGTADSSGVASGIRAQVGGRPVVEISAQSGGKPVDFRNDDAPVLISIPYTPTEEEKKNTGSLVVLYLDDGNQAIPVPNGKYDPENGAVTFYTTHFSKYAVAQVTKTFGDIGGVSWAKEAIEALACRGIAEGITKTAFKPNVNITRGDFTKLLISTLGLSASFEGNFSDVAKTDSCYQAVGIAKKLGVATGYGNNRFEPKTEISRQDLIVLTVRALEIADRIGTKGAAANLKNFADQKAIASYAAESVATFVKDEIIRGNGAYLRPKSKTTRAEAAVILYRVLKKY